MYTITNWDDWYETCETRKYKTLKWIPLPVKLDGRNYQRLMKTKRGPQIFGCWCAILEAASKGNPRGVFMDRDGNPYNTEDIALVIDMPEPLVAETLTVLSTPPFDWVSTATTGESPASAGEPAVSASLNRIELNRIEQKNICASFEAIWKRYIKRKGKKEALTHFKADVKKEKGDVAALIALMDVALEHYLESDEVKGGFIQHGSTWFNNWRDWIEPDPLIQHAKVTAEYAAEREQADKPSPEQIAAAKVDAEARAEVDREHAMKTTAEMRKRVDDGTASKMDIYLIEVLDRVESDGEADGTEIGTG